MIRDAIPQKVVGGVSLEKRQFISSWGLFGEIFLDVKVLSTDSIAQLRV